MGKQIPYGLFDFPPENVAYCINKKEKLTLVLRYRCEFEHVGPIMSKSPLDIG